MLAFRKFLLLTAICMTAAVVSAGKGALPNPLAGRAVPNGPPNDWRARLTGELPLLGHRNWIAVVDSAYPLQTSSGIETIETNADQLDVVRTVLDQVGKAKHVRAVVFTDAELQAVPENDAAGVTAYREALSHLLGKSRVQSLPHEEIIAKLDDASQRFHVLVLKSSLTIPYTSVFIRLDCGYWTDDAEQRLRQAMKR